MMLEKVCWQNVTFVTYIQAMDTQLWRLEADYDTAHLDILDSERV
jgi:hypothetical protein